MNLKIHYSYNIKFSRSVNFLYGQRDGHKTVFIVINVFKIDDNFGVLGQIQIL